MLLSSVVLGLLVLYALVYFFPNQTKIINGKTAGGFLALASVLIFVALPIESKSMALIDTQLENHLLLAINLAVFSVFFLLNRKAFEASETLLYLALAFFSGTFLLANSFTILITGLLFVYCLIFAALIWSEGFENFNLGNICCFLLVIICSLFFASFKASVNFKTDNLSVITSNIQQIADHQFLAILLLCLVPLFLFFNFADFFTYKNKKQPNLSLFLSSLLPVVTGLFALKLLNSFSVLSLGFGQKTQFQDYFRLFLLGLGCISACSFFFRARFHQFFCSWSQLYMLLVLLFYSIGTKAALAWCTYSLIFSCALVMVFVFLVSRMDRMGDLSLGFLQSYVLSFKKDEKALLFASLILSLSLVNRGHGQLMQSAISQFNGAHLGQWGMPLFFAVLWVLASLQLAQLLFFSHGMLKTEAELDVSFHQSESLSPIAKLGLFFPLILLGIYPSPLYKYILKLIL